MAFNRFEAIIFYNQPCSKAQAGTGQVNTGYLMMLNAGVGRVFGVLAGDVCAHIFQPVNNLYHRQCFTLAASFQDLPDGFLLFGG